MPTYSTSKLTEELQKAVASRKQGLQSATMAKSLPQGRFEISSDVTTYLQKMRTYRAQARTVRVGQY